MKKWLAICLAVLMLFALAACGEKSSDTDAGGSAGNNTAGGSAGDASDETDDTPRADHKILTAVSSDDEDGSHVRYVLTDNRRLTSVEFKDGEETLTLRIEYTDGENTAVLTDKGASTTLTWDENGRILTTYEQSEAYLTEFTYDEAGRCISEVYTSNGEYSGKTVYTYNDNGDLLSETRYNSADEVKRQDTRTYNEHGDLVESVSDWMDGDPSVDRYRYTYDDNGYVTTRETLNEEGRFYTAKRDYTYDEAGRVQTTQHFNGEGILRYQYAYVYDADGDLVTEQYLNHNGELRESVIYTYETAHMSEMEYGLYLSLAEYVDSL